jgi:hypothetical protein
LYFYKILNEKQGQHIESCLLANNPICLAFAM